MAEFVGVTPFSIPDLIETKQQALLFDRIVIPGLSAALEDSLLLSPRAYADLHYLSEQGFVAEARLIATREQLDMLRVVENRISEEPYYFTRCVAEQMRKQAGLDAVALETSTPLRYRRYRIEPTAVRGYSVYASCFPRIGRLDRTTDPRDEIDPDDVDGDPVDVRRLIGLPANVGSESAVEATASHGAVVDIVLKRFPCVLDDTPWEKIFDVRRDEGLTAARIALRRWMRKIAKEQVTPIEIEQEIDYLLAEYEDYLRRHKMAICHGTLRTIVVGGFTAAEDLVKVKWGKLAESLFAVSDRQILLLKEELNAPGRELSYLVKVGEKFTER